MLCARLAVPLSLLTLAVLAGCEDNGTILSTDAAEVETDAGIPTPLSLNPLFRGFEGYTTPGEVRSGYVYGPAGEPIPITYEVQEGLAIWEGDIVIGRADEIAATPGELSTSAPGPFRGPVTSNVLLYWPGGVIPYTITTANAGVVADAIDLLEDGTPGVTLIPRTTEANYVTFQDGGGCSSSIGMQGGQQFITLKVWDGTSWCPPGSGSHEILHTLGMYHEHSRCDRDGFVTIDYAEVESGKEHNFWKAGAGDATSGCSGAYDIDAYDYGSIMHYPVDAFAIGTNPTIIPTQPIPAGVTIGQRDAIGPTDAATIDALYGANNAAPTIVLGPLASSYDEGSPVPFDASGTTDADDDEDLLTFSWTFGDGACPPAECTIPAPSHIYADNGSYPFSITVTDGFDPSTATGTITVLNVAPSVDAGSDAVIDEGDTFTGAGSFTDPGADTWTATVDYGDGSGVQPLALAGKNFNLSHTYIDNDVNTVAVTVTDDDGGTGSDDVEVTVLNVPPTVDAGPDATVDSGETYDFSGTFSDPGIDDDPWLWVISWGFGPNTTGSTDDQSAPIEASRQVCVAGVYTVRLTVTDKDGGAGWDELTLTVPYIPVGIDILPETDRNPVNLKGKGALPVAILGSADLDVAEIDPSTLVLGDEAGTETPILQKNNGSFAAYMEDVNGDGYMDLVADFPQPELVSNGDLTELTTQLVLRGFLLDGCTNIRGADFVDPIGT